jgi:hypothetical protein
MVLWWIKKLFGRKCRAPARALKRGYRQPRVELLEDRDLLSVSFVPTGSYAVGPNADTVVAADFNRDGKPDLAVTSNDGLTILLGNGDGTFQSGWGYGISGLNGSASPSSSLAVGDLNGDGIPDLVVTSSAFNTQYTFLGQGDGSFALAPGGPSVIKGSTGLTGVVLGDFNGDGKLDEALSSSGDGQPLTVLLGNGDGTFGAPVGYDLGNSARSLAVADFNGDGRLDLAVTNYADNDVPGQVTVLFGNGDGTFQAAGSYATGNRPFSVAVGDFTGDGRGDLVVVNANDLTGSVSVSLNHGDGTFAPGVKYAVGADPRAVTVADFNGDGKTDIAVANWTSNTVSVLYGNGDGTFQPAANFTAGTIPPGQFTSTPYSTTAADFNGDGKPDLAVTNFGAGAATALLNVNLTPVVTVTASANSSVYGEAVTFSAAVVPASGNTTPTGSVQFFLDGAPLGAPVSLANGVATTVPVTRLPAGTHIVTATYSGDGQFLRASGSLAGGEVISSAPLTVTAEDAGRVYGNANPAFTVRYSGFVPGEGPSVLGGTLAFSTDAAAVSDVGAYLITPAGLTSANYAITYAAGTLTVTPAPLTVVVASLTKVYGLDSSAGLTGTIHGIRNGDAITAAYSSPGATATAPVGAYTIAATLSGGKLANYAVTILPGTLTVVSGQTTTSVVGSAPTACPTPGQGAGNTQPQGVRHRRRRPRRRHHRHPHRHKGHGRHVKGHHP